MAEDLRSADLLVKSVLSDSNQVAALKIDPEKVLNTAAAQAKAEISALQSDPSTPACLAK